MIYEIKKAVEALFHPGIETNFLKLVRNSLAYYFPKIIKVQPPLTIYFSINSVCNLSCKMCDVGMANEDGTFYKNLSIDKKLHEISIETFKSIIDEVYKFKPFISFSSTEPLLYKDLEEAIRYCRNRGLHVAVTTGGYMLPKKAEMLAKAGLSRLNVSIDGPSEIHNDIRGKKDSFERDIEGIRKFYEVSKEVGNTPEINVSCVISNLNYKYIVELADSLEELPIKQLSFAHLWYISNQIAFEHNSLYGNKYPVTPSCYDNYIHPKDVDIDIFYEKAQQLRNRKNIHFFPFYSKKELHEYYKTDEFLIKDSKCLASWFIVQILADGRVMPYTRCHNDSFGNVNEDKFMNIWNGEKMQQWRKFIKDKKRMPMCKRCDLVN